MAASALHSTRVIAPSGVIEATLTMADGMIQEVLPGRVQPEGIPFESVGDKVIMPGVIDAHVHINEPGRTEWEGFETATKAAAAGGITTLIEMPLNASPVTTTMDAFNKKLEAAKGKLHVNCGFYGGVIPTNTNDLNDLLSAGVFGIKAFLTHSGIDEFPNVTEADLRKALPILKKHDAKLLVHCELETVSAPRPSDPRSYLQYLASRPRQWENDAIDLMIRLSEEFDVHVHIVHVSSAEALPLIRDAKKRGLRITAETCPHYLVFCAEEIPDGATEFKCAPPIRKRGNNELLWEALRNGTLDFVATDHSPAPPDIKEQKSGDFMKAWGGIAGLQFLLPAFWTGARERGFSLEDVARLLCEHPAQFLGLKQKGRIAPGCDSDLVIWDPEASFAVKEEDIEHRHKLTPYTGRVLFGVVHELLVTAPKSLLMTARDENMDQKETRALMDWVERTALDLKPDDIFPVEEKRIMLGHMIAKEWGQLGWIIMKRAIADWRDEEAQRSFLTYMHNLPEQLFERLAEDRPSTSIRARFQLCDMVYQDMKSMADSWRTNYDAI